MATGLSVSNSTVFVPEVAAEAVNSAIEGGLPVMFAGEVFTANPGLPRVSPSGEYYADGDEIIVPYWDPVGKFERVPEGNALQPKKMAQSTEKGTVHRFGVRFTQSNWNRLIKKADDPYEQIAMLVPKAMAATMDDEIADNLFDTISALDSGKYVHTVPTNGTITWPDAVQAKFKLGDEIDGMDYGLIGSKVAADVFQLADDNNRPFMLGNNASGNPAAGPSREFDFMGTRFRTTDRKSKIPNTSPADYYTAFCKPGCGAIWYTNVEVMEDKDGAAGVMGWTFWFWAVVHTYKRMQGSTKPGATLLKSR